MSRASIRVREKLTREKLLRFIRAAKLYNNYNLSNRWTSPAPGVLSITGQRAELIVREGVVQVTVVGVVEHGLDSLSETGGGFVHIRPI